MLAMYLDWKIHQIDFDKAYLNGILDEELYMEQLEEFIVAEGQVCRLRKAIYDLKQAGCQWFLMLKTVSKDLGFVCHDTGDVLIFVSSRLGGATEILVVYIDDLMIMANSLDLIAHTKEALSGHFSLKDLGELKHYLNIHITRDRGVVSRIWTRRFTSTLYLNASSTPIAIQQRLRFLQVSSWRRIHRTHHSATLPSFTNTAASLAPSCTPCSVHTQTSIVETMARC